MQPRPRFPVDILARHSNNRTVRRFPIAASLVVLLAAAGSAQRAHPGTDGALNTAVTPFFAEHCFRCHGSTRAQKGLNLEELTASLSLERDRERWDQVILKLRQREMPPPNQPQPPDAERQAVVGRLEQELDRLDRAAPINPGHVTARRLNRTEYNNTIRDLLGVDVKPADDFPQDDSGYGFDNIGDVLSLSPSLMEKYITAADKVARLAVGDVPKLGPTLVRLRSDGRRVRDTRTVPAEYDATGLTLPNAFHAVHRVPVDGEYLIRVFLAGVRPAASEPIDVTLWADERLLQTRTFDLERAATFSDDRQDFGGQTLEFRVRLDAGDRHLAAAIPRIFEGLPPRYRGPNPSMRPDPPPREFKPPRNATPERIAELRKQFDKATTDLENLALNTVRVNVVEVGGPYEQAQGRSRESRTNVFTCGHLNGEHQPWCATRVMSDLARRAFRRPVTSDEVAKLASLVDRVRREERSWNEGFAAGIQAILVSPDFLFRIERDPAASRAAEPHALTPHELATRLSYFLWASMPDDRLRRAADAGTLRDPHVLEGEVRRMLRDPKSRALADHFGGQWLQTRALESVVRDRDRFPDFEEYLRFSMRRETDLFLDHVVREDRSILDLIEGRYSFLNERLARHYGIAGVSGPEFRRVELTGTPRAGVLTQASVLTVSSYATRTSPVLRGKWILDNLLNAPPPAPPPDVPNLDEKTVGSAASMREQLEAHRRNPTCAACHRRMDPLGFGLENFDAVGAWRAKDAGVAIDASGSLPDGRAFQGPDELRAVLSADRAAFAECLTSKLLTYALGRGLESYDKRTVKAIAGRLPSYDYRFSGLVLEIVNSVPFRFRAPRQEKVTTP